MWKWNSVACAKNIAMKAKQIEGWVESPTKRAPIAKESKRVPDLHIVEDWRVQRDQQLPEIHADHIERMSRNRL